jgi:hypothetical protein
MTSNGGNCLERSSFSLLAQSMRLFGMVSRDLYYRLKINMTHYPGIACLVNNEKGRAISDSVLIFEN